MEIFYSDDIAASSLRLPPEESAHCAKVLRRRAGDVIEVIDGEGTLYKCTIVDDNPRGVEASIDERLPGWNSHPYHLTLAVCPTKNNDRYEWFAQKAVEFGVDCIAPVIGERSERKVFKTERIQKIALSATKQSLKARLPQIPEPLTVKEFIKQTASGEALKLIAYCFEDETHPRQSIKEVLKAHSSQKEIIVLVGPEGDFSLQEAKQAIEAGYVPVHLGTSRLRTETAGIAAAAAVYFEYL